MSTFTKQYLSGSTTGKGIEVAATSTPGTLLHTADASAKDEIWLWASNKDSAARVITIEWGGVTVNDDLAEMEIPADDTILIVPGWILGNSLVVRGFGAAANVITVFGYVNRIS